MDVWILAIPLLIVGIVYADKFYREEFESKPKPKAKTEDDTYIKKSSLLPCTAGTPPQEKDLKKTVLDLPHVQMAADWENYSKSFELEPTLPNYRAFGNGLV